jgi:hypothetical protein
MFYLIILTPLFIVIVLLSPLHFTVNEDGQIVVRRPKATRGGKRDILICVDVQMRLLIWSFIKWRRLKHVKCCNGKIQYVNK